MHITQILPNIDQQTQKITVLSALDKPVHNLFVNTFLDSKLFLGEGKSYLTVKKSALSFFNNEWVVFVPEHHNEDEHRRGHTDVSTHEHDEHNDDETRRGHAPVLTHDHEIRRGRAMSLPNAHNKNEHKEHKGHGHEEEEEVPYDIRVVKILKKYGNFVAIEGLKEHEDYVSDKSYYIKSMLLKSSLGGHGH